MSPIRLAKLTYRSACAIAVLAQIEAIPSGGVTVTSVRVGACCALQVRLTAEQGYSVRIVDSAMPFFAEVHSHHETLIEALLDLGRCEAEYLACDHDDCSLGLPRDEGYIAS